jgi:hypothetical protein
MSMPHTATSQQPRIIGRKREYDDQTNAYGPWQNIIISANETEKTIHLSRGGKLVFRPHVLSSEEQTTLTTVMQNCKLFRQYSFGETYTEPRSHVLLSSKIKSGEKYNGNSAVQPGYVYHGICMKAYPLDQLPEVERLAERLARLYGVDQWNTGVDLIAYKDGEDRIGCVCFVNCCCCCCLFLMWLIVVDSFAVGMLMIHRVRSLWIKTLEMLLETHVICLFSQVKLWLSA